MLPRRSRAPCHAPWPVDTAKTPSPPNRRAPPQTSSSTSCAGSSLQVHTGQDPDQSVSLLVTWPGQARSQADEPRTDRIGSTFWSAVVTSPLLCRAKEAQAVCVQVTPLRLAWDELEERLGTLQGQVFLCW